MLCVISHQSCWYDPQHQHQGQKGVCHVPPGGLGDYLQCHMGYLQIHWDSQIQNTLLVVTWHPHHQHQGPKGVGHEHLGALGNHLQGYIGYLQIYWDSQMHNILWVGPTTNDQKHQWPKGVGRCRIFYWLPPGTHSTRYQKVHVPPGAFREHLHVQMGYQLICCHLQMQNILLAVTWHPHHHYQRPKGVGHVPPAALRKHLQGQTGYGWADSMGV